MELIKLTFVEHEGLLDQAIRPYDIDMKGSAVDLFSRATEDGYKISAKRMANVASPLMGPSARRKFDSHIDNGWGTKRIMFAMVVRTASRSMSQEYHYIVGYSDESRHTTRGTTVKFDPGMRLYFNNITRISLMESVSRDSRVYQPKVQAHDQILNRSAVIGFGNRRSGRDNGRVVKLRPTDLFTFAGGESAFGAYLNAADSPIKNLCGAFSTQLCASSRTNNSSTNFMHRSLDSFVKSSADPSSAYIDDNHDHETIQRTIDSVQENNLENDPYMEEIRRDTNILQTGYITYGELMDMNPDFDEDRNLPFRPVGNRSRSQIRDNIVSFKSDETESIAALMIAQALPGILINSMYSSVKDMVISTYARTGESKLKSAFPAPFVDGMSIRANWPYFEDQIENILIPEVSKGGMFDFEARIDANIDQEIRIWITMDGGEEAYFVFPAFCDSLLAPTLGNNVESFELLSKGVVDLAGGLSKRRMRQSPTNVPTPVILTGTDAALNGALDSRGRSSEPRGRTERNW